MNNLIDIPWPEILTPLAGALLVSLIGTPILIRLAKRWKVFDWPGGRRIHTRPTPRLGGIVLYLAVIVTLLFVFGFDPRMYGLLIGVSLMFGLGLLDDIYQLPPIFKLLAQLLIASIVVMFGITIGNLTNPLGGTILLPPALDVLLTIIWILLIVNTINWLDGLDGLAAGVSAIASLILIVLSLFAIVNQPETATVAAIVLGASVGFLFYNWHPAKIFMGDSGSYILGFMLATIAIISGGKLATAALVLGLPILDLFWAVFRRIWRGRAPWQADKEHLHHRLLEVGLSQPTVVLILYAFAIVFGMIALLSGPTIKMVAFILAVLVMVAIVKIIISRQKRSRE